MINTRNVLLLFSTPDFDHKFVGYMHTQNTFWRVVPHQPPQRQPNVRDNPCPALSFTLCCWVMVGNAWTVRTGDTSSYHGAVTMFAFLHLFRCFAVKNVFTTCALPKSCILPVLSAESTISTTIRDLWEKAQEAELTNHSSCCSHVVVL